ncbi:MAG: DM13 domain-containing protein [Hydrogenophaga sp.]|uniref:DM13 domain-containing protein n=1 Tax=Hydrogenophaga sp. TaxID=1904254 RepID=UPI003D0DDE5D
MKKTLLLLASHALVAILGFGAGVYFLPILIAPPAPEVSEVSALASKAQFTGRFRRELAGSDALHWGEGTVSVGPDAISLMGRLAPGPDYKLYLSPSFVQTEAEFLPLKDRMLRVGDVKTFENFVVSMPPGVDLAAYNTVVVWCETFKEFISAAQYR